MNEASKFKKYQMWYKVKELISKHLNFEQISSIVGIVVAAV